MLAGVVAVVFAIQFLLAKAAEVVTPLQVVDAAGKPLSDPRLEFFVFDDSGAAASPTRKLGEILGKGTAVPAARSELVPEHALVRVTAPGYGIGYFLAQAGDHPENRAVLARGTKITGQVASVSRQPLAGARVLAFGGGAHGVLLTEARSGTDGGFVLEGISPTVNFVLLRVLSVGHAVLERERALAAEDPLLLEVQPTEPVSGRVAVPAGVSAQGLVVQALNVPGVATTTDADGRFAIDHLPGRPFEPRLIVTSLPAGYTHRVAKARAGMRDLEITVSRANTVSGVVVTAGTGQTHHFATVRHDHGPRGQEVFRLDEFGRFVLGNVPAGEVTIEAFPGQKPQEGAPYGKVIVNLAGGQVRDDLVIEIR